MRIQTLKWHGSTKTIHLVIPLKTINYSAVGCPIYKKKSSIFYCTDISISELRENHLGYHSKLFRAILPCPYPLNNYAIIALYEMYQMDYKLL